MISSYLIVLIIILIFIISIVIRHLSFIVHHSSFIFHYSCFIIIVFIHCCFFPPSPLSSASSTTYSNSVSPMSSLAFGIFDPKLLHLTSSLKIPLIHVGTLSLPMCRPHCPRSLCPFLLFSFLRPHHSPDHFVKI